MTSSSKPGAFDLVLEVAESPAAPQAQGRAEEDGERQTDLYHPSVASLLSKLTQPEVAAIAAGSATTQKLTLFEEVAAELEAARTYLLAHEGAEDPLHSDAIQAARRRYEETTSFLSTLAASEDEEAEAGRQHLLDAYFGVGHLLEASERPAVQPPKQRTTKKLTPAPVASPSQVAQAPRSRRPGRRLLALGSVLALALIGRLALFVASGGGGPSLPQVLQVPGGVETVARTIQQPPEGPPVVVSVQLAVAEDGSLVASAIVVDRGGAASVSYRWMVDGKLVVEEPRGEYAAQRVRKGARYQVQVIADEGGRRSAPLESQVLTIR